MRDQGAPDISVVIPARNEAANLEPLLREVAGVLAGRAYEIVVADDASSDGTGALLARLAAELPLGVATHAEPRGQSAALQSAVLRARAPLIVTLDGDGQNDPSYIPAMLGPFADPAVGIVAGQRLGRKGTFAKRVGSRIANALRRTLLKDGTADTGCGIKALRRDAYLALPYFDTMHRFLPALFLGDGWTVAAVEVVDRPRLHGKSHYGVFDRLAVSIPDLFGVWWLIRRRRRNPGRRWVMDGERDGR